MAQEKLTIIDDMSPALRRIVQEAQRLQRALNAVQKGNRLFVDSNAITRGINELNRLGKAYSDTSKSIRKQADAIAAQNNIYKYGKNNRMYYKGRLVSVAQEDVIRQRLVENYRIGQNNRAMINQRLVNGKTFEERAQKFTNSVDRMKNSMNSTSREFGGMQVSVRGLRVGLNNFAHFLNTIDIISNALRDLATRLTQPGEQYFSNYTRMNLTSDLSMSTDERMKELFGVATRSRSDAEGTFMLYNRIALSGMKTSNQKIQDFVETFNKTMAISGTTGQENRAVMLQLAQGLGSNRLGGDEYRSIAEQAPMFKFMLAKGLGVNPGELKRMGAEGLLTADTVVNGLLKVKDEIDEIYKTAPWLISQIFTVLSNKWTKAMQQQTAGYIALRDVFKDLMFWIERTPEGQRAMQNIIGVISDGLGVVAKILDILMPIFKFVIKHLSLIMSIFGNLILLMSWLRLRSIEWGTVFSKVGTNCSNALLSIQGTMLGLRMAINTSKVAIQQYGLSWKTMGIVAKSSILGIQVALKGLSLAIKALAADLVVPLLLMLTMEKIAQWAIEKSERNKDYKQYLKERQDYYRKQKDVQPLTRQEYNQIHPRMHSDSDWKAYTQSFRELKRTNPKQYKQNLIDERAQYDALVARGHKQTGLTERERLESEATKAQAEMDRIKGLANTEKNKAMQAVTGTQGSKTPKVKANGGYIDKVNDVTLDNDAIEMMKMIAERMWVIQNEVTVPQDVTVNLNNAEGVDEATVIKAVGDAIVASVQGSMRGAVMA